MENIHVESKPNVLKWVAGIVSGITVIFMASVGSLIFNMNSSIIRIETTQNQFKQDIVELKNDVKKTATKSDLQVTSDRLERRINAVENSH